MSSRSSLRRSFLLIVSIVITAAGCRSQPAAPAATELQADHDPPVARAEQPSEAVARADALLEDMRRREAQFMKLEQAAKEDGLAARAIPVVTEITPRVEPRATTSPLPPITDGDVVPQRRPFDILSSEYAVTERNRVWWRFSWKITVRNQSRDPIVVSAGMEFKDASGFILDTGTSDQRVIDGSTVVEISDTSLVSVSQAVRVTQATATIRQR